MHPHPCARTRCVALVLACLVAGAVVNVAVAWACVAWGTLRTAFSQMGRPANVRPGEPGWLAPEMLDWPVRVPADWPQAQGVSWCESFGVEWRAGATGWDDPKHTVQAVWSGWPLRSMRWVEGVVTDGAGVAKVWTSGAGPIVPVAGQQGPGTMSNWGWVDGWVTRRLPLRPVWPGFAVNTVVFAGAAWVLVVAPLAVVRGAVRARRRGRGECEGCGYALAGLEKCPECGSSAA